MSDKPQNGSGNVSPLPEDLVAYLDGELEQEAARQIEQRLADDGEFRERLHQYQQAWDILDELPKTRAGDRFADTTLEMVAVSANRAQARLSVRSRKQLIWISGGLGVAASVLAGYLTVATIVSRPNNQLIEDLPVIEDLDAYRHAESIDFLQSLAENGLFLVEDAEDAL